jgi:hypothetical protein
VIKLIIVERNNSQDMVVELIIVEIEQCQESTNKKEIVNFIMNAQI